MSKAYNFDWQIEVPTRLLKGDYFDRWDEENGSLEQNCLFRVDSYGFFIYWQSEGRDGQVIELSQVSDIRPGKGKFSIALVCISSFESFSSIGSQNWSWSHGEFIGLRTWKHWWTNSDNLQWYWFRTNQSHEYHRCRSGDRKSMTFDAYENDLESEVVFRHGLKV